MTSNLGSDVIQTLANDDESSYEMMREAVMEIVGSHFRPEFINRIDEAVVFHPLEKDQIRGIADIQLDMLRKRLQDRELALELSDAAISKLVDVGYDPVFGARPLKRAIQQWIENPLAQEYSVRQVWPRHHHCGGCRQRPSGVSAPAAEHKGGYKQTPQRRSVAGFFHVSVYNRTATDQGVYGMKYLTRLCPGSRHHHTGFQRRLYHSYRGKE